MYQVQCLERQLAIMLATKYRPGPVRLSRKEFDNILEALFSATLGQLVGKIKNITALSEDEEERLVEALERRNWLAHRYFWERSVEFLSESGRASMVKELQVAADSFGALDRVFTDRTIEYAETLGVTQESIDKAREGLVRESKRQSAL